MKKFVAICACLILFALVLIPRPVVYSQQRDNERERYASDRIIVKLKAEAPEPSDLDSAAEEIVRTPGVKAETLTRRPQGGTHLIRLNGNVSVEEAMQRAKEDPRVEFAEPDYFVYATDTVPNDPRFSELWGMSSISCSQCAADQQALSIDATRAWDITTGSDNIVVAVLDTGVDLQHPDLAPNAWVNPSPGALPGFTNDVNGWNFYDDTNQTYKSASEDFHGTHVAGSIGAVGNNGIGVAGVAWHVKLMALKFLGGTQGKGSTSNAVLGINYAIAMRNRGVNVRVINASWGGGSDSQALRQAIAAAGDARILFVAAAGNGSANIDDNPDFPAAYAKDLPNAMSVAALDNTSGYLATFSNFGHASVSLAAPGTSILSTYPGPDNPAANTYSFLSGTSMSTPYVSGIAVLLWAHEPSLTPAQVKQRIIDTSEPTTTLVSKLARSGRANAYDALTNRFPPVQRPVVLAVNFTKTAVIIDGFGFLDGSAMIEVDGTPLSTVDYDSSFALANGTLTRLTANIGKKPLKRTFPYGTQVSVDVFNPTTGDRSAKYNAARF
jgi:subtilisin family serine protease